MTTSLKLTGHMLPQIPLAYSLPPGQVIVFRYQKGTGMGCGEEKGKVSFDTIRSSSVRRLSNDGKLD